VISTGAKRIIKERSGGMIITDDFNSRYADIVDHKLNWKMYDWLTWVDVWAGFILMDV
jgi:hypothetical protein